MAAVAEAVDVRTKLEHLLGRLNGKLNEQGFQVDLMSLGDDNIAKLRPSGCEDCRQSKMMVQYYLSKLIKKNIPEIEGVICV